MEKGSVGETSFWALIWENNEVYKINSTMSKIQLNFKQMYSDYCIEMQEEKNICGVLGEDPAKKQI